ncbi:MAG: chromosome segregation protein SMC [Erysipelotrichia bacterium]|nr:chromosome segregation protein SMC [Erysipelotrichia bacterium]
MFLKRVELQGFKSFADKTIITFDSEVTGIVGPNGCGKSNINDAIRWVLGEQSAKSLRGGSMSDVIFSGSQYRNAVNVAEVTLVFDNSRKNLNVEFEEVEITRRLHRHTGEGEYYINKTPCRLKDITNMIMDSGLGRDSLSVISQGNISSFADSKPDDRRPLFEEAAGVAKYKKRKNESLSKLNRTQENLLRVEDIIEELEHRVNPLKRQAKKAELFLAKKAELEKIEISVIVDEVEKLQTQIEEIKNKAFDIDSQKAIAEASIQIEDQKNQDARKEMSSLDGEIHRLQTRFMEVVNEISALESRKVELDEKRKYALEFASNKEKMKQLKAMMQEALYEYQDREKRVSDAKTDLSLLKEKASQLENDVNDLQVQNNKTYSYLNKLENRKEVLSNLLKQPFNHQQGVKAIMQAKKSLYGIKGVISQLLKPHENYEQAISNALGAALYHIVSVDSESARHAIHYLKKNQSGRATFLPLTVLKPRWINEDDLIVCKNSEGFLGCANEFISCDEEFRIVNDSLLGNVIICDELKHANELAALLKYRYKIITLDGDVVHKGGSMSGGKVKDAYSPLTIESELKQVRAILEEQLVIFEQVKSKLNIQDRQKREVDDKIVQMQLAMAQLQPVLDAKKAKYDKLKDEYEQLNPEHLENEEAVETDDLVVQLSNQYSKRDEISNDLSNKREKRYKLGSEVEKREANIRMTRRDLSVVLNIEKEQDIQLAKAETNLENALSRLSSTYEMTFEHAKELKEEQDMEQARADVLRLRDEITRLGNVNLDAPAEYEEVSERYEMLTSQRDELNEAKDKILSAIDEMDDVMKVQFKEMFDKINDELDDTFKSLFGGGKAKLFLSDPEDILNSGIEINAQPPGKDVKSMQLLSGGEKSMIAMCVLFAILKARTVPLCIFDEVEAALDQANVERFAKYISRFRGDSQFIIVTHRPGTMAQCDSLYGVTMKKNGVSQFLKVNLQDAMNYVEKDEVKA